MNGSDHSGEFGPIYLPALQRVRDLWLQREPFVDDSGYDDPVDPSMLWIELSDGLLDASSARIDIRWSELGNYSFHYVETDGVNWRFDRHPNPHSPDRHFHPPPDAATADAESSCIQVEEVSLVTRAVDKQWKLVYETGDLGGLNGLSNPP